MEDTQMTDETPNLALETPIPDVFVPPSVHRDQLLRGESYTHYSPVPPSLLPSSSESDTQTTAVGEPCCLGVDEAGRGPVLGDMVYGVFYLPLPLSDPLLKTTHHFDDSKVLTPAVRSDLMQALCTAETDLHASCGWATYSLSARDISANMLKPTTMYNLNAQAMDATISLIRGVFALGVNVREIYVDTIGQPAVYQKKLERIFPTTKITVAKKADSLYPCVSAASVCAKVTRDAALEVLYEARAAADADEEENVEPNKEVEAEEEEEKTAAAPPPKKRSKKEKDENTMAWGSGYPSDARCVNWLRSNMHPVFGWGPECRFSWGTAKDMLDGKGGVKVEWPLDEDESTSRVTDFFVDSAAKEKDSDELGTWFGTPADLEAF